MNRPARPAGRDIELRAADGTAIAACLYEPDAPSGRAVVIHPATGAPQTYYARFAGFLAEQGWHVLSFDYRGIGASRAPGSLRSLRATMSDGARLDAGAALAWVVQELQPQRCYAVGHSFGGQTLGLVPGADRYAACLAVASQSGYWRHWPGLRRAGMWLVTHAVLPGVSRAAGYFPMAALGQGEDLPAGVAREWAAWCRHPEYLVGHLGAHAEYARLRAPLRVVWIADDYIYAPRKAAEALLALYPNAKGEIWEVSPQALGVKKIGHFGFFRDTHRETLWREAAKWLARCIRPGSSTATALADEPTPATGSALAMPGAGPIGPKTRATSG